ncbi:hypothetical protein BpHYR1_049849 [Brachionus plicatilis]|uniref:Uncharacterized protein n=1 Tax=Brachionus plicatilis TaxID=10195 RepID=A0A3M7SFY6_BRAPC|nr:hypothetical protein BpHYR1_049849 [Brachionus plicatilis]
MTLKIKHLFKSFIFQKRNKDLQRFLVALEFRPQISCYKNTKNFSQYNTLNVFSFTDQYYDLMRLVFNTVLEVVIY